MIDRLTCILCPIGCELEVEVDGGIIGGLERRVEADVEIENIIGGGIVREKADGKDRVSEGSMTFPPAIFRVEDSAEIEEVLGRDGPVVSKGVVRRYENAIDGRGILVRGYQCDKGIDFAAEEVLHPKRNLASSVPLAGTADRMVSVRLSDRVPREMIFPILAEIAKLRPSPPIRRGEVLIENVGGSGVDVIATRTMIGDVPSNPSLPWKPAPSA